MWPPNQYSPRELPFAEGEKTRGIAPMPNRPDSGPIVSARILKSLRSQRFPQGKYRSTQIPSSTFHPAALVNYVLPHPTEHPLPRRGRTSPEKPGAADKGTLRPSAVSCRVGNAVRARRRSRSDRGRTLSALVRPGFTLRIIQIGASTLIQLFCRFPNNLRFLCERKSRLPYQ